MVVTIVKNSDGMFECVACDYTCSKKQHILQHRLTRKHKMITNDNGEKENALFPCLSCGNVYKYICSLGLTEKYIKSCLLNMI